MHRHVLRTMSLDIEIILILCLIGWSYETCSTGTSPGKHSMKLCVFIVSQVLYVCTKKVKRYAPFSLISAIIMLNRHLTNQTEFMYVTLRINFVKPELRRYKLFNVLFSIHFGSRYFVKLTLYISEDFRFSI